MLSLRALVELYRAWLLKEVQAGNLKKRTFANYYPFHERFIRVSGDVQLSALIPFHLMAWAQSWHEIQAVQRLFNWAMEAGLVDDNPFRRVKRPPLGQRKRILTRPEEARLLRASNPRFREFLLGMRESMARPEEIRLLDWCELQQLGPAAHCFVLDEFKARRRRARSDSVRIIPITPRLMRLLDRLRRRRAASSRNVWLNTRGKPWTSNAVRCGMFDVRHRVGLLPDRRGEEITCYSWRHTAATRATAAGIRDRVLADLLGHTSTRTTARYQHLDVLDLVNTYNHHLAVHRSWHASILRNDKVCHPLAL